VQCASLILPSQHYTLLQLIGQVDNEQVEVFNLERVGSKSA
jgi:hypothetical protein